MTAALRDDLVRDPIRDSETTARTPRALVAFLRRLVVPAAIASVFSVIVFVLVMIANWIHDATLIETVRVEGSFRTTTQGDIQRSMSSLVAGHSLLAVPMSEIATELSALSWVSAVDVYRVWPHGLIVRVTEKVPVAHWNGDGFISHTGEVFQPENAGSVAGLPLLAGPPEKAAQIMAFYSSANSMLMPFGLAVSELKLNDALSWEIVLGNGIRLRLDQADGQTRLRRFLHVYEQRLYQVVGRIATVDLRYIGGFAIGWKPAAINSNNLNNANSGSQAGAMTPGGENGAYQQQ